MPPRPFWKGYLKLSLVTCPVAMTPATSQTERLRFHTLNRVTGNRVTRRYVDAVSGAPVADADEVKGYPRGENDHVMLEDDELDRVALDSARTIDIEIFAPADTIPWVWYDTPHYLTPNDPVGEEAFAVIRDAMAATGTVGVSRLVLYRRERAVMLKPRDNGIVLWTLRYGDEVRDEADYFPKAPEAAPDPKLMALVKKLIDERRRAWSPEMVDDPVRANLREIIAAKQKGKAKPAKKAEAATGNVVDIMEALRRSIAANKKK